MKPIIIVPTYNEKDNVYNLVEKINENLKTYNFSILFVDDSSQDGTKEIIENLQKKYDNILLLNRAGKLGLASAYVEGINLAIEKGFNVFVEMDADFSHNPKYLSQMLELLKENDVVIGSRNIKGGSVVGWGLLRNFISKGGSLYSRLILNCPIKDLTGGFNGWTIKAIQEIDLNNIISKGYSFQIEMKYKAYKKNLKIQEFPIVFEDRKFGQSKMSKKIFFEAILNVIKIKFLK